MGKWARRASYCERSEPILALGALLGCAELFVFVGGDLAEEAEDGGSGAVVRDEFIGHIDKGYVDAGLRGSEEGVLKAIGLAASAAHLDAVNGLAEPLLWHRYDKPGSRR